MWYGCSVCAAWARLRWIQIEDPKQGASAREKPVVVKKEIKQTATVLGWKTFVWILWFLLIFMPVVHDFAVAILGPASTKSAATGSTEGEGKSTYWGTLEAVPTSSYIPYGILWKHQWLVFCTVRRNLCRSRRRRRKRHTSWETIHRYWFWFLWLNSFSVLSK